MSDANSSPTVLHHTFSNNSESSFLMDTIVTLRILLTTKGAGVCIGFKGSTIDELRTISGTRAGVSKLVEGVNDRVLSIEGTVEQVPKAVGFLAQTLLAHPVHAHSTPPGTTTLRFLIPNAVMGSIIGRGGAHIKSIQDSANVRIVTAKDPLPASTERVVDVTGDPQAIEAVGLEFARTVGSDWDRVAATTRLYDPSIRASPGFRSRQSTNQSRTPHVPKPAPRASPPPRAPTSPGAVDSGDVHTQRILFPAALVGGVIGRGGSRIGEIRQASGATILISKEANQDGEREFTVTGTQRQVGAAFTMVYDQFAREKERLVEIEAHKDSANPATENLATPLVPADGDADH